jgi:hypothetical protein
MTRLQKCELAIQMGYTYNPISGKVYGIYGKEITGKDKEGYITINNSKFRLRSHQFAWYWVNKKIVDCLDHINGVRYDNKIENLRAVTKQQNSFNRKTVKGYYWSKQKNKWYTNIVLNGKRIHLGFFDTKEKAKETYIITKEKLHLI